MGINRLGILHISDLHFGYDKTPDTIKTALITDDLRSEMPHSDPRELFLSKSRILFRQTPIDIIAFTGDFGIGKEPDTIDLGIKFLKKLGDQLNIPPESIVIAPGNHDLNREAELNKEFDMFIKACSDENFKVATRHEPVCMNINGLPIMAMNTCLGGTEQAFYGLPDKFWNKIRNIFDTISISDKDINGKIPDSIKEQLEDMDIPAIGTTQIDRIFSFLGNYEGNCVILLGHHNLLPTPQLVVRPYADIIDSGQLLYSFLKDEKRVIFLHGHTHCDSSIIINSPEYIDSGFLACLGGNGLHGIAGGMAPSASYIQVLTDEQSNFLVAIVSRYLKNGYDFTPMHNFYVWDKPKEMARFNFSIDSLEKRKTYYLDEIQSNNSAEQIENLALELLKRRSTFQLDIADISKPIQEWRVTIN